MSELLSASEGPTEAALSNQIQSFASEGPPFTSEPPSSTPSVLRPSDSHTSIQIEEASEQLVPRCLPQPPESRYLAWESNIEPNDWLIELKDLMWVERSLGERNLMAKCWTYNFLFNKTSEKVDTLGLDLDFRKHESSSSDRSSEYKLDCIAAVVTIAERRWNLAGLNKYAWDDAEDAQLIFDFVEMAWKDQSFHSEVAKREKFVGDFIYRWPEIIDVGRLLAYICLDTKRYEMCAEVLEAVRVRYTQCKWEEIEGGRGDNGPDALIITAIFLDLERAWFFGKIGRYLEEEALLRQLVDNCGRILEANPHPETDWSTREPPLLDRLHYRLAYCLMKQGKYYESLAEVLIAEDDFQSLCRQPRWEPHWALTFCYETHLRLTLLETLSESEGRSRVHSILPHTVKVYNFVMTNNTAYAAEACAIVEEDQPSNLLNKDLFPKTIEMVKAVILSFTTETNSNDVKSSAISVLRKEKSQPSRSVQSLSSEITEDVSAMILLAKCYFVVGKHRPSKEMFRLAERTVELAYADAHQNSDLVLLRLTALQWLQRVKWELRNHWQGQSEGMALRTMDQDESLDPLEYLRSVHGTPNSNLNQEGPNQAGTSRSSPERADLSRLPQRNCGHNMELSWLDDKRTLQVRLKTELQHTDCENRPQIELPHYKPITGPVCFTALADSATTGIGRGRFLSWAVDMFRKRLDNRSFFEVEGLMRRVWSDKKPCYSWRYIDKISKRERVTHIPPGRHHIEWAEEGGSYYPIKCGSRLRFLKAVLASLITVHAHGYPVMRTIGSPIVGMPGEPIASSFKSKSYICTISVLKSVRTSYKGLPYKFTRRSESRSRFAYSRGFEFESESDSLSVPMVMLRTTDCMTTYKIATFCFTTLQLITQHYLFLSLRWKEAVEHSMLLLRDRNIEILKLKGTNPMVVPMILHFAHDLTRMESMLEEQIYDLQTFCESIRDNSSALVDEVRLWEADTGQPTGCLLFELEEVGKDLRSIRGLINGDSVLVRKLENLIQKEFNLVSIHEAQTSVKLGLSMQRLSWITFIFLPLIFVSSLFGMNIDVLQADGREFPSWWWYLIFSVATIALVFGGWMAFKYYYRAITFPLPLPIRGQIFRSGSSSDIESFGSMVDQGAWPARAVSHVSGLDGAETAANPTTSIPQVIPRRITAIDETEDLRRRVLSRVGNFRSRD
ncbi:hypothetical protein BJ508DRAFT_169394 [Ascobolus immersus RN42]|uniref:Cora-domain-containing protein n=1 Tax=Ascobolus immersus RN42 TaxID=1160509 RepID=A0A3N4HYI8_ASCIM|nr:hypothetical protein BJ508DRAFT_169394 [Ascobolus immersus RN42]